MVLKKPFLALNDTLTRYKHVGLNEIRLMINEGLTLVFMTYHYFVKFGY